MLILDMKLVNGKVEGFVGVVFKIIFLLEEYKIICQYGFFSVIFEVMDKMWQLMKLMVSMLGKLIIGDVKLNNFSGLIFIVQGVGMLVEFGVIYYLMFFVLISVNLGIINLFLLFVFDGGYLLFLVIEKFKGGLVFEWV